MPPSAPTRARRGRPRGLNINVAAFDDLCARECVSKGEIADAAGITSGHLSDALYRQKGLSEEKVRLIAGRLRCSPATLAPELTKQFVSVRPGDELPEAC